jgi:hypothetical protein
MMQSQYFLFCIANTSVYTWGRFCRYCFNTSKPALLQIVITGTLLNIKMKNFKPTNVGQNTIAILLSANDFENNKNYRLYDRFYSSNGGLIYMGLGDFAIRR